MYTHTTTVTVRTIMYCVLRAVCCVLRVACCALRALRAACCVLRPLRAACCVRAACVWLATYWLDGCTWQPPGCTDLARSTQHAARSTQHAAHTHTHTHTHTHMESLESQSVGKWWKVHHYHMLQLFVCMFAYLLSFRSPHRNVHMWCFPFVLTHRCTLVSMDFFLKKKQQRHFG